MKYFIIISLIIIIACLAAEAKLAAGHRRAIKHVIHVNGTRGKSAVSRLIAAGCAAGGLRTYCKTTGTLPMTIDTNGNETEIKRIGRANISEQIKILKKAAADGAEVLVIECMAVDPELQRVCERKILRSDIGVITNVRIDHVAEMGETIPEVCEALCETIPENGIVFTADERSFDAIRENAGPRGSEAVLVNETPEDTREFLFPENIALALRVCEYLGIERRTALEGMKKVIADPYEAKRYTLPGGAVFVNAMSANDPESTGILLSKFINKKSPDGRLIIIQNNRADRAYRIKLMAGFAAGAGADEIWQLGSYSGAARRIFEKSGIKTEKFRRAAELPLARVRSGDLVFAIGNIADEGIKLMNLVEGKEESRKCTEKS
ncbi:MAG: poly-gamma-glutamate synthase PgsB [Lachnospiraceae bacterium]|nr:poly-gamma-glutamate synthase PgsB [Lachnospiraceae bacterium]